MQRKTIGNIKKCIYMLISPSKKCYIGKSVNLKRRFKEHKCAKGKKILYKAIRKYGWDNFDKVIIEVFEDDISDKFMSDREIYWIAKHGTLKPGGYNCTIGGEGCSGLYVSVETRAKLRAANTGYKHTPEALIKIRANALKLRTPIIGTEIKTGNKRKFDGMTQAAEILSNETGKKINNSAISQCANKKRISHHGWTFEFVT